MKAAIIVLIVAMMAALAGSRREARSAQSVDEKQNPAQGESMAQKASDVRQELPKTEEEWMKVLSPAQFEVLRKKGTERPFTGEYYLTHVKGVYRCAACGAELFGSDAKFDSGCGWPSFSEAIKAGTVKEQRDTSHGMVRTEVLCARCGSHLGHVFDDGPGPTGLRYCINSVSLKLQKDIPTTAPATRPGE